MSNYDYHLGQILAAADGALLTPLKTAAKILGLATRTLYNQIHKGTCKFEIVKHGSRAFIRATDLAEFISGEKKPYVVPQPTFSYVSGNSPILHAHKRRGRPLDSPEVKAAKAAAKQKSKAMSKKNQHQEASYG